MSTIERTTYGADQFIVNQDRTKIYPLYLDHLHSEIREKDGIFIGINLYMDIDNTPVLLGTFETVQEIIREINEIFNTDLELYCVSNYEKPIPTLPYKKMII